MKQRLHLLHEGVVAEPFDEGPAGLLALALLLIGHGPATSPTSNSTMQWLPK